MKNSNSLERTIPHDLRPVPERSRDFSDIHRYPDEESLVREAGRCGECSIPFCHGFGCPLGNLIPDMNALVHEGRWREAVDLIHRTNNFPEITGRICPALCEDSCTMDVGFEPISISQIETAVVDRGFSEGWITPQPPRQRLDRRVAVIGSGPAGLAAAQQLNRAGYRTTVFESAAQAGGMLRYGIPNFKLEKWIIDRRLDQMTEEGVEFQTDTRAGEDLSVKYLQKNYDALLLANGCWEPRRVNIEGDKLEGVHFALDFLGANYRSISREASELPPLMNAKGKHVIVIGGGDTGSDCVGTAHRQGAADIVQLEILPQPPETRAQETPWPNYAKKLRTSSSHEEAQCERRWSVLTKKIIADGTGLRPSSLTGRGVRWFKDDAGRFRFEEVEGSDFELPADMVLLATGFVHPIHDRLLTDLGVAFDRGGRVDTDKTMHTNVPGVFAAGDVHTGPSLVVRAITAGREAAAHIDAYLR